jgi:hypothetical protein
MELTGTIKKFLEIQIGVSKSTGKEWKKQSFVVSNNEGYEGKEQLFCFEVFGSEKVDNLSKYQKIGDKVKVAFNINTNEWQNKYFTSLSAWRIENIESLTTQQNKDEAYGTLEENTDLPF